MFLFVVVSLFAATVSAKAPILDLWSGSVAAEGRLGRSLLLRDAPGGSFPQVLIAVFNDDDSLVGGWSSSLKAAGATVLSFLPKCVGSMLDGPLRPPAFLMRPQIGF